MTYSTSRILVSTSPTQKYTIRAGWFAVLLSVLYVIFQLLEKQPVSLPTATIIFVRFVIALERNTVIAKLIAIHGSGIQMQNVTLMLKLSRELDVRRRVKLFLLQVALDSQNL